MRKASLRMQTSNKDKKAKEPGSAAPDSPEASYPMANATILDAINSLRTELQTTKFEICQTIDTRIEEVSATIRGELLALKTETQNAIHVLKTSSDQHGTSIADLERAATQSADAITTLESEIKRLRAETNQLTEKYMDLEGRTRRQNIRIAMLREGAEKGAELSGFASQLLKDVLTLDDLPLVDRAHRALRRRPDDTGPPRTLVVRLHYYRDVTMILRKAATLRDLTYRGQKIRIFPDFTPEIAQRRAAFNGARALLRDKPGVRYGLLYPAKLKVTYRGTETMFTDAKEAQKFAELHFGAGGGGAGVPAADN